MNYEQLVGLLSPGQFEQMQAVKEYLLKDPSGLDKAPAPLASTEEKSDGNA